MGNAYISLRDGIRGADHITAGIQQARLYIQIRTTITAAVEGIPGRRYGKIQPTALDIDRKNIPVISGFDHTLVTRIDIVRIGFGVADQDLAIGFKNQWCRLARIIAVIIGHKVELIGDNGQIILIIIGSGVFPSAPLCYIF